MARPFPVAVRPAPPEGAGAADTLEMRLEKVAAPLRKLSMLEAARAFDIPADPWPVWQSLLPRFTRLGPLCGVTTNTEFAQRAASRSNQ